MHYNLQDDQSSLYNLRRPRQFKGRAESRPRPLSMPVDLSAVATLDLPDISNMPRHEHTIQESVEEGEEESQMVGSLTRIYITHIELYIELAALHHYE